MPALPIIALAAGTALNAIGRLNQGEAEGAAADYNAKVDEQRADLAVSQASSIENRQRVAAKKQIGQARANYGASGVQIEGTPEDVLGESAAAAELDALTIRHAGEIKAIAYRNAAALEGYRGKTARLSGKIGAAGAILSAGGMAGISGGWGKSSEPASYDAVEEY